MQELTMIEIDEVSGGKDTGVMLAQAGGLILMGGLAIATGGFSLIAVGTVSVAMGGTWASLAF